MSLCDLLYARAVGLAAASFYGGAAGFTAYTTRLDGGSFGDAVKAGAVTYATGRVGYSAYMTRKNGGSIGDSLKAGGITLASSVAGQTFTDLGGNYILGGAGAGAFGGYLNGGDPGEGALLGATGAIAGGTFAGRNVG